MASNLQVLLDYRPTDKMSPANFRVVETPVPTPGPGEVLVRHSFLSLDPYMRGRLSDAKSYFLAQRFAMHDKDIIYVANADFNELQKFFTLLNTLTGPVITGIVVKNAVP